MRTTALRQLLKSLCYNSHWKYAVFWKLEPECQLKLTWEDGYCDYLKPGESIEIVTDDISSKGGEKIFSSSCETSVHNGSSGRYPIGLAVADMSCLQYVVGEGFVGKAAYTGNHCWVFADGTIAGEYNSKSVSECPDEWLLQFAAGISTILLVPVVPHGVLQLGSLEMVAEDLGLVAYIKNRFNALQDGFSVPFNSNNDLLAQASSSAIFFPVENLDESSTIISSRLYKMYSEDSKVVDNVEPLKMKLSTTNQVKPLLACQDDVLADKNEIGVESVDLVELSSLFDQAINANQLEVMKNDLFGLVHQEDESLAFSQYNNFRIGECGDFSNGMTSSHSGEDMMEQWYVDKDALPSFFSFPIDCELHKALGLASPKQTNECTVSGEHACKSSSLSCNRDPSAWESSGWSAKGGNIDHLLESVVTKVNNNWGDTSSDRSNSVRSSTTSVGQFSGSFQAQSQSKKTILFRDDSVPCSHVTSTFVPLTKNAFSSSSTSASASSGMSRLIDEEQQNNGQAFTQPKKGAKSSSVSKRRDRSGDKQRSRPRDRQMIQDRVKELRELVPNGSKCSIDGLLDRTINHMLFLRSVADRGGKLGHWKPCETESGSESGISWAFQLGSGVEVCPIIVEDLEYPGHMLIEMICDDHGLFLEIAQVIRGLDLTISKGVMESRSNNMWAQFIVEVSRGFHRMDIFWPLMQLLQRNIKPISSKI